MILPLGDEFKRIVHVAGQRFFRVCREGCAQSGVIDFRFVAPILGDIRALGNGNPAVFCDRGEHAGDPPDNLVELGETVAEAGFGGGDDLEQLRDIVRGIAVQGDMADEPSVEIGRSGSSGEKVGVVRNHGGVGRSIEGPDFGEGRHLELKAWFEIWRGARSVVGWGEK